MEGKTVEQLEAENAELTQKNSTLTAEVEELKSHKVALQAKVDAQAAELSTAEAMIDELNKSNARKGAAGKVQVTHKGKTFEFSTGKFRMLIGSESKVITAEEAAKNEELIAELLKADTGILVPVNE